MDRGPSARARLYFNLAWCHSVTLERLRYRPVGWSKGYEFSDTDFQVGLEAVDTWLVRAVCRCVCVVVAVCVRQCCGCFVFCPTELLTPVCCLHCRYLAPLLYTQDKVSAGAAYVNPEAIPWSALVSVLVQSVYGGRVDNAFDLNLLT